MDIKTELARVAKVISATGEMGMHDIQPGGEYYGWAKTIEKAAKEIESLTKKSGHGVKFVRVRPFDVYQGPYAEMDGGKLWSGEKDGEFFLEMRKWAKDFTGTEDEIAEDVNEFVRVRKDRV